MKNLSKVILLIAVFAGWCTTLYAQSTQGKEFWVSSTLVCSPDKVAATPYIAISAEKACTVKIQGGVNNAIDITQQVAAGSWNEFGNGTTSQTNPNAGMIKVPMDASKWYPVNMSDATSIWGTLAGQKNMYGLHITATENVSVYVILSSRYSMDASNILPITALGCEYYTQDYTPEANESFSDKVSSMITILGTEDNTTVDITPNGETYDGWRQGSVHQIMLNKGQTYYLISKNNEQLAGTHIMARDGRKIAVFNGAPLTRVPNGRAARDCLFEQSMPIDYWGTQFIVTRSLEKNGNLIGITATQRGTEIKIDGYTQAYINEGETYYIMLQSANDPNAKDPGTGHIDYVLTQDAAYIETSCPCAVYSYDTGNSYVGKNGSEIQNGHGDPSSVWVSPVQQKINRITFGTCYTEKTKDHFLNVITETATCQQTKLIALYGVNQMDKSNLLVWTPVEGNPTYSYARAKIGDSSTAQYSVFRLENSKGIIATVYGNGEDESYAYSAGSAAVEQGVNVEGETFTEGYRSDSKFCIDAFLNFDAKVGTDEISRVDWTFGDGTTEYYGQPQTTHQYTSPGWYDVTAKLYGRQVCTVEDNKELGTVHFSFRVVRADTVLVAPQDSCISLEDQAQIIAEHGQHYLDSLVENGGRTILNPDAACYETKQLSFVKFGLETETVFDSIVRDGVQMPDGNWYDADATVKWTISQPHKCDQHYTCNLTVITCLDMTVTNDPEAQKICPLQSLPVAFTKTKGSVKTARFVVPGVLDEEIEIPSGKPTLSLPTESIRKPGYYNGQVVVEDLHCGDTYKFPVDFAVLYPEDIIRYKFNNVLAVYNSGYGGNTGYTFKAYQWYLNYQAIEGAIEPTLYLGDGIIFEIGDVVYVELTDMNDVTLPSCPMTITKVPDYTATNTNNAPARKTLIDNQFRIIREDGTYDIYGQKVE